MCFSIVHCFYTYYLLCGSAYATAYMWIPEDNFQVLVLFFYHLVPRHQTWLIQVVSKSIYPLSCLTGPGFILFVCKIKTIEANCVGLLKLIWITYATVGSRSSTEVSEWCQICLVQMNLFVFYWFTVTTMVMAMDSHTVQVDYDTDCMNHKA